MVDAGRVRVVNGAELLATLLRWFKPALYHPSKLRFWMYDTRDIQNLKAKNLPVWL